VSSVDFTYLEGFVGGSVSIALEVVALFRQQAPIWAAGLEAGDPEWRAVVHTIKGAARGIGANALGDVCQAAEQAGSDDLSRVQAALDAVVAEILAYEAEKAPA
jgi:HPt (histidine-containing phosphotransfer) domain-containing protein